MTQILKMEGICKSFPGVRALDGAGIEVLPGEVHALVGENGAGKSTLMKILNGLLQPDSGEIFVNGTAVHIRNPAHAQQLGIAMIYQELNPVRDLTVADNLFLGREPVRGTRFLLDKKAQNERAQEMLENFGLNVDARTLMKKLSIAQMQMVEILKAVSGGAKLIVMDEPTSSLADEEIKLLFGKIHELVAQNVAIIYITHRLEELPQIADRITVLRDGRYIGTSQVEGLSRAEIIQMMVGREVSSIFPKVFCDLGEPVLEVKHLSGRMFQDASFTVRKGEILGFYGLVGAGRSELLRAVFGLDAHTGGEIVLNGETLEIKKPIDAIQAGIAMVPEDRKELGLTLCRSIRENIALPNLQKFEDGVVLNARREEAACEEIAKKLSVKMHSLQQLAGKLSGGNQQKVVLCKWLMQTPKVLILDEPTRGIDVGAKAEIHSLMCEFAKQGMAFVMISSELPEVMGMSDRILVMGDGHIKGEFKIGEYSQNEILKCALGGNESVIK